MTEAFPKLAFPDLKAALQPLSVFPSVLHPLKGKVLPPATTILIQTYTLEGNGIHAFYFQKKPK